MDLAQRSASGRLPLKAIEFVWVIRSAACTAWIDPELKLAAEKLHNAGVAVSISTFITRDGTLVEENEQREGTSEKSSPSNDKVVSISSADLPPNSSATSLVRTFSGRPDVQLVLRDAFARSDGEMGVAVSGPMGLATCVKKQVASMALGSVSSGKGIYLHSENFGW